MKGFIAKTVTTVGLSGAVLGCYYRDIVDPCYPQRYEYAARRPHPRADGVEL